MAESTLMLFNTLWLDSQKWMTVILPSAAGSVCSLKSLAGGLTMVERLYAFLMGLACSTFIAPAIVEVFEVPGSKTQLCIYFLVGLFALAVISEIFKEIPNLTEAIKRCFFGEKRE